MYVLISKRKGKNRKSLITLKFLGRNRINCLVVNSVGLSETPGSRITEFESFYYAEKTTIMLWNRR